MNLFTENPKNVRGIVIWFIRLFKGIFKATWVLYLAVFWITYAVNTGVIDKSQGSAIAGAFLWSWFVIWAIWLITTGAYKVIRPIVLGDLKQLRTAFDNFDGLIFGVILVFLVTAFFFPRFLMGIHVFIDVILFYITAFFSLIFVFYSLVCLTERKLILPKKRQRKTES